MKKRLALLTVALTLVFGFAFAPIAATSPVLAAPAAQDATGIVGTVLASQLYIRSRPSVSAGVLGATNWGDKLQILGRNPAATWFKIRRVKDGTVGWVSAFWVRMSVNVARNTLPIVQ